MWRSVSVCAYFFDLFISYFLGLYQMQSFWYFQEISKRPDLSLKKMLFSWLYPYIFKVH